PLPCHGSALPTAPQAHETRSSVHVSTPSISATLWTMRNLAIFLLSGIVFAQTNAPAPVAGMQNFIHSVANLEKSVAFYRDVFGLEMNGELRPPNANPTVLGLVNAAGAKFRAVTFKIPGAAFGLELTEFTGIDRKPAQPNHWDPGAADL